MENSDFCMNWSQVAVNAVLILYTQVKTKGGRATSFLQQTPYFCRTKCRGAAASSQRPRWRQLQLHWMRRCDHVCSRRCFESFNHRLTSCHFQTLNTFSVCSGVDLTASRTLSWGCILEKQSNFGSGCPQLKGCCAACALAALEWTIDWACSLVGSQCRTS
jgi:hypothetical protein